MPYPSPADEHDGDFLNLVLFIIALALIFGGVPTCIMGLL